jgi:hypothetical protein
MDFTQSDIQQIASLTASQVVEQLKNAGYQTGVPGTTPQMEQSNALSNRRNPDQTAKQPS